METQVAFNLAKNVSFQINILVKNIKCMESEGYTKGDNPNVRHVRLNIEHNIQWK